MAHIGQRWKLAFRRDLSTNVDSNRFGWAEQYLFRKGTDPGGNFYGNNQPDPWISNPAQYSVNPCIYFTWPPVMLLSFSCTIKLSYPKPYEPGLVQCFIFENIIDGVVQARFHLADLALKVYSPIQGPHGWVQDFNHPPSGFPFPLHPGNASARFWRSV